MFKSIKKIVYFLLSNDVFINYKIAKIDNNYYVANVKIALELAIGGKIDWGDDEAGPTF